MPAILPDPRTSGNRYHDALTPDEVRLIELGLHCPGSPVHPASIDGMNIRKEIDKFYERVLGPEWRSMIRR